MKLVRNLSLFVCASWRRWWRFCAMFHRDRIADVAPSTFVCLSTRDKMENPTWKVHQEGEAQNFVILAFEMKNWFSYQQQPRHTRQRRHRPPTPPHFPKWKFNLTTNGFLSSIHGLCVDGKTFARIDFSPRVFPTHQENERKSAAREREEWEERGWEGRGMVRVSEGGKKKNITGRCARIGKQKVAWHFPSHTSPPSHMWEKGCLSIPCVCGWSRRCVRQHFMYMIFEEKFSSLSLVELENIKIRKTIGKFPNELQISREVWSPFRK